MTGRLASVVRGLLHRLGIDVVRYRADGLASGVPADFEPEMRAIVERVRPYTMTTPERLYALCQATAYVARHTIPGVLVECGVWRGGSMMAAALTLQACGVTDRDLWLFDTFEGMTEPGAADVTWQGLPAGVEWRQRGGDAPISEWCRAGIEEVRRNMQATGYPSERIRYVPGKVEDTLPAHAPEAIALLRLDTDWYESTRCELEHLYPRLASRGVLILDDYGHWQGARKAVDEYFAAHAVALLLNRIDYTGRIGVKP